MNSKKFIDPFDEEVKRIALAFDAAMDEDDSDKQRKLIQYALDVIPNINSASKAHLYYSLGTTYGEIARAQHDNDEESIKKQLYYFRKSITIINADDLNDPIYSPFVNGLKMNLYTNYGNTLDRCGRKIAAIDYYKKALTINLGFGMAAGNLGVAYNHYARLVSNSSHRDYLHHFAYRYLCDAIRSNNPNMVQKAVERYREIVEKYDTQYREQFLEQPLQTKEYLYKNGDEQKYREWAVKNTLFLNPLNDLPTSDLYIAADVIQLPPIVTTFKDRTDFHGMFNQIKQEYIYSRFQYYHSLVQVKTPHYADKDTFLIDSMDYSQYSIRLEMLKSAFKTLYSLLDKIAYFINHYFELGIRDYDTSFFNIWKCEKKGKNGYKYRSVLNPDENLSLSSLYWISKDFYEKFLDSPNPQAERIKDIRNALEHRFVKITLYDHSSNFFVEDINDTAFVLLEDELSSETLKLLKILREVIICLSITIGIEEKKRNSVRSPSEIVMPFKLTTYDDDWKR